MRKQIMLKFLFLFSFMMICETAFAQFKVDDLINQQDNSYHTSINGIIDYDAASDPYSSYNLLDDYERYIYDSIYSAASSGEEDVYLTNRDMNNYIYYSNENRVSAAIHALMYDHPEFVWLKNGCSGHLKETSYKLTLNYNSLAKNARQHQREFEEEATRILKRARQEKNIGRARKIYF